MKELLFKLKVALFKLKGKTIGYSPCRDEERYKKYILKE
jgi:hypothetical protein